MLTFGLPPAEYFRRLQTHLDDGAAANLPPEIVRHLITICDTRLTELDHNPDLASDKDLKTPRPHRRCERHHRMTPPTTRLPPPLSHFWEWQLDGECRTPKHRPLLSREGEGKGARLRRERVAKEICAGCSVTTECRNHAIAVGEPFGIWGGTSEADRRSRHNSTDQEPLNRLRRFRTSTEHPRPGRSHQRRSPQNVRTKRERHPEGP